jgi:hypothetical protein
VPRKKPQEAKEGTLIRGADGALYYVSDDKKWAFLLPNKYTEDARSLLDREGFIAKSDELPAIHGSGLIRRVTAEEVRVELNRLALLSGWKTHRK